MKSIIFNQNKKFYDKDLSYNLTLHDINNYLMNDIKFIIIDNKTKKDITNFIINILKSKKST